MKKAIPILASVISLNIFALFLCNFSSEKAVSSNDQIITDVLKLETIFTGEDTGDFLIAWNTGGFALPNPSGGIFNILNGNYYILDEFKVKIYDPKGKPITLLGGKGQGPGEFEDIVTPMISENGTLAVMNRATANIYSPDHNFIKSINTWREHKLVSYRNQKGYASGLQPRLVYAIDPDRYIFGFDATKDIENDRDKFYTEGLWYITADSIHQIVEYIPKEKHSDKVRGGRQIGGKWIYRTYGSKTGEFFYDFMSGDKVVYTHSGHDAVINDNDGSFTLHIFDPQTLNTENITFDYQPLKPGKITLRSLKNNDVTVSLKKDIFKDRPFLNMQADNEYIYLVKRIEFDKPLSNGKDYGYRVDVIHIPSKKRIGYVYMPFIPRIISNGYAYYLRKSKGEFPQIEKYKIDPSVYGK
ncbi:hypothetical protein ACFL7D_11005 [candidate division KSB1 bacterium]